MWPLVATLIHMEVGIRELKNRLSEYVRRVRAGEVLLVTDRGEVVAELHPPGSRGGALEGFPGLAALARQGVASLGGTNEPGLYEPFTPAAPAGTAAALLDAERGER